MASLQKFCPQDVSMPGYVQLRCPLHLPAQAATLVKTPPGGELIPGLSMTCFAAQSLSGSVFARTGVQVPWAPGMLHASQTPSHAESQQSPSTHGPPAQSLVDEHARPMTGV